MLAQDFSIGGKFFAEAINPDGSVAWREELKNGITNVGLNNLLDVHLGATAKNAAWYIGLIDSTGYSSLAAADTMSSHAGWSEHTSGYSQSNRPTWSPGSSSGQSVTNASTVDFTITSSITIKGMFLTTSNTKGGTTGTLWCTALFTSGDQSLVNGQTLKITYTCSAAGA